jgi:hypothetical protein
MHSTGRVNLEDTLGQAFSHYKIVKTQVQWRGASESLPRQKPVKDVPVRYELIVKGCQSKKEHYFEVLSESDGTIVSIKEIVQRSTDNLIY